MKKSQSKTQIKKTSKPTMIPGTKLLIKGGAERWRVNTLKNLLVGG